MRFEHQGIALWYATPDAPAPEGVIDVATVDTGSGPTITVGVSPQDPSNTVQVRYRVNGGAPVTVDAPFLRADGTHRAQYFRMRLPRPAAADQVDYTAVCRCVGRQVPGPDQTAGYLTSFRVAASPVLPSAARIGSGLNGSPVAAAATTPTSQPAADPPAQPPGVVAIVQPEVLYQPTARATANRVVAARLRQALRTEVVGPLGAVSPRLQAAVDAAVSRLSWDTLGSHPVASVTAALLDDAATDPTLAAEAANARRRNSAPPSAGPTVAEALHLNVAVRDNPLLRDAVSLGLTLEFARLAGLGVDASQAVAQHPGALLNNAPSTLAELSAHGRLSSAEVTAMTGVVELAKLTDNNLALISALGRRGAITTQTLAGWGRDDWLHLIAEDQIPIPPGETDADYADVMIHNLAAAHPVHAIATHSGDPHLARLVTNNPHHDLQRTDLVTATTDHLDWTGIPRAARPKVEQDLRAYQRVVALADTTPDRLALIRNGYDSATAIASKTAEHFTATSGVAPGPARLIYARAQNVATSVAHQFAALRGVAGDAFTTMAVSNLTPLVNELLQIVGLKDLFGPQDYCDCDDYHSVLSPAAYFVDLMHFVDTHVSRPTFVTPGMTDHPLHLKQRRPDLWTLPLTADNTTNLIPYLQIVNEVLQAALVDLVDGDVYQTLADPATKASFRLPANVAYTEFALYLSHFTLTPADIYRTLQAPPSTIWRAQLGIAPEEAAVIATPDPDHVAARLPDPAALAAGYDLQDFLRASGLQRAEFDQIRALRFRPDLAAVTAVAVGGADDVQPTGEQLHNLSPERLDFIHRLVRLQRATHWKIDELDLVLVAASEANVIGTDIDGPVVELCGRLTEIGRTLSLGVEELCALVGQLPVSGVYPQQPAAGDRRLYERLFDLKDLFEPVDKAPALLQTPGPALTQTLTFHHHAFNTLDPTDTAVDPKTPLLLAGLAVSETDLLRLLALLSTQIPFDQAGNCVLDRARLSLLYRPIRTARALHLSIDDLLGVLELLFGPPSVALTSLDQVETLITFTAWLKRSPFAGVDLRFILAGAEGGTSTYTHTIATAAALVRDVRAAAEPDTTKALSVNLAKLFNLTAARLADTLAWTGYGAAGPAIAAALAAPIGDDGLPANPSDLQPLLDLLHRIERVTVLFTKLAVDDRTLGYLTRHQAVLGIGDLAALTRTDIQALHTYTTLTTSADDRPVLEQVLDGYQSDHRIADAHRAQLATLWNVDPSLIDTLCNATTLPGAAVAALGLLHDRLSLCTTLGVNAYTLAKLGDTGSYPAVAAARDVAVGAVKARYPDPTALRRVVEPLEDQTNTAKRDALCEYILARRRELRLTDRTQLYDLLLLDADMSGCARTSRVVAAIASVQHYVQRCLLNLEQSDKTATHPPIAVHPDAIPGGEWAWRKNYRVWEANRKVFLYPESYLDPDLLDNKTPLLTDVEDDLLQQQITKDTAEAAYRRYLTEFANLAHLRIAGSCYGERHDAATNITTGTYYFFGRTQSDPPVYYWRTWDTTTWTPWQKIDLTIDAPAVSAAVHRSRLYLFWVDAKTKAHTSITGGTSSTDYYEVDATLLYTVLDATGKWRPAQRLDQLYPVWSEQANTESELAAWQKLAMQSM